MNVETFKEWALNAILVLAIAAAFLIFLTVGLGFLLYGANFLPGIEWGVLDFETASRAKYIFNAMCHMMGIVILVSLFFAIIGI